MKEKNLGPIISLRDGKFEISIWSHEENDKENISIKLRKSWKGNNDEWSEHSINMSFYEISKVIMLLSSGYHDILNHKNLN